MKKIALSTALALMALVYIAAPVRAAGGLASISEPGPVTITFSYDYVYTGSENPRLGGLGASCSLTLPRGSDGVEVLQAAVNQDCINSFRTVSEGGVELLHCINEVCDRPANSTALLWGVDWTGKEGGYWHLGLGGYAASDGDYFSGMLLLMM